MKTNNTQSGTRTSLALTPGSAPFYARRPTEDLGEYYIRHVEAMTAEGLHSKSAIAAELAVRDMEIERLSAEIERWRDSNIRLRDEMENQAKRANGAEWALHAIVRGDYAPGAEKAHPAVSLAREALRPALPNTTVSRGHGEAGAETPPKK